MLLKQSRDVGALTEITKCLNSSSMLSVLQFAGCDFPPYIVFKVYMQSSGKGLKYISGKRAIRPASEAAADACRQMGNRKFYDLMLQDFCQSKQDKITDELDVTNLKEYMQYLKNTDELPASLGGKDNSWRKLSLEALPRQNIMYDIMTFVTSGYASPRLTSEMPHFVATRPKTQETQLEMLHMISSSRSKSVVKEKLSGRRTKKARERVAKMRKMYGIDGKETPEHQSTVYDSAGVKVNEKLQLVEEDDDVILGDNEDLEDNWEGEGKSLYEWSQNLSLENASFMSP
eukprot:gene16602-8029_t